MTQRDKTIRGVRQAVVARRKPRRRAALSTLVALSVMPLITPPCLAQSGANSNPSGGQSANGVEAGGAAAAGRPAAAPQTAISVLLQQASFWRGQNQNGRALEALTRALMLDPGNPEALALTAQIQAEQGNTAQAATALQKLREVAPNDARITQVDRSLRIGQISPTQLAEARRLAQEGRNAEAIQRYQQIFRGNPPPDPLGVEYYSILSGTDGGWEQARDGLAQMIRDNPSDLRAQLAYAQLLTYREGARNEGIARLARLAQNPAIGDPATKAWRQALGWLPVTTASIPALNDFLTVHPNDPVVQRLLEAARNPPQGPPDIVGEGRIAAFRALNANQLAEAERGFEAALAANANDADALGGLGLVRLRQGRTGEARSLLQRAIDADPANRGRWQAALAGSRVPEEYANIRVLANRGDYAAAERQIHALMGRGGNPGLELMLADVQARSGDLAAAEATYRGVLTAAPRSNAAMVGLAGVLEQQGRTAEAEDLLSQAGATGNLRQIAQARAERLRAQASEVTDPATKVGLYRAALAADPDNPWIRLDLARALVRQGHLPEATSLMDDLTSGRQVSSDALQAAIIFASENNLSDTTAALISRVPPGRRTAQMRATLAQAQLNRDIQATLAEPPEVARQRLLALATAAPDPDGSRGAAIARALFRMGDAGDARAAIAAAQTVTRAPGPEQRLSYAGALMDIGDTAGAQRLLSTLNPSQMTPQERTATTDLREGLAVRSADQLNQAGRRADAYDRLAPVLQQDPASPNLNLALARLYSSADNPREALAINLSVLRRDPANIEARHAAVSAALAVGDRTTAERLVAEGLQINPNDPRAWITSADLARARGNTARAIRDLEHARQLRQQQIGGSDAGGDYGAAPRPGGMTQTLAPDGPPVYSNNPPAGAAAQPIPLTTGTAVPTLNYPSDQGGRASFQVPYRAAQYQPNLDQTNLDQSNLDQSGLYQPAPYRPAPYGQAGSPQPLAPAPGYDAVATSVPPVYTPTTAYPATQHQFVYSNPFRSGGESTFGTTTLGPAQEDPMTAQINQSLAALRDQIAPTVQGGIMYRGRTGSGGLDSLTEIAVPLEATYSPGGFGQLRVLAQPTYLSAGTLGSDALTQGRLGTQALSIVRGSNPLVFSGPSFGSQHAEGVALDAGYRFGWFSADIGATPIGFDYTSLIGGIEIAPKVTNDITLRLTGERRAVTDSLLSYGGQKDPRTGADFGGVTHTRGYGQIEFALGLANFYLGGGYGVLTGHNVERNNEIQAGAGASYPIYRNATDELRTGLDVVYFGFQRNLSYFTLGQGGYFSPQNYLATLIPLTWTSKAIENLTYSVGGAVGLQTFNENSSLYYPGNPGLQARLSALAAGTPGVVTYYAGQNTSGITGVIKASAEYSLSPSLRVGGIASFQHAGTYSEGQGLLYARYIFNGAE